MSLPAAVNDAGFNVTVGAVSLGNRMATIFPIYLAPGAVDPVNGSTDAVESFIQGVINDMCACMAADSYISYVAAEPMTDDRLPDRADFASTAHPGTTTGGSLPSNVCGLLTWYEDPADGTPGHRMRTAKNFMPSVPDIELFAGILSPTQVTRYSTFMAHFIVGIPSLAVTTAKYYRCLAAPKPRTPATNLRRIILGGPRSYVATQRRRLIPH